MCTTTITEKKRQQRETYEDHYRQFLASGKRPKQLPPCTHSDSPAGRSYKQINDDAKGGGRLMTLHGQVQA